MSWNNSTPAWPTPDASYDPMEAKYGAFTRDELLMEWEKKKKAIEIAKNEEMNLRKFIVKKAFPEAKEGMNTIKLGNGYDLKAAVKFNYTLAANDVVEKCLNKIAKVGNEGSFIADRLVSWKPTFLLTEYRTLIEEAEKENGKHAKEILKIVNEMLTITDAAPTLEIKEPKQKK